MSNFLQVSFMMKVSSPLFLIPSLWMVVRATQAYLLEVKALHSSSRLAELKALGLLEDGKFEVIRGCLDPHVWATFQRQMLRGMWLTLIGGFLFGLGLDI
jgi:hypothetical protein